MFELGTHPQKYQDVKICTYAMCKNELQFVETWLTNIWNDGRGSDYIIVHDTGSTDGTLDKFKEISSALGIPTDRFIIVQKSIEPWRFDVARNYGMQFFPNENQIDVCYSVDLDEEVIPEFWDDLRKIVFEHPNFSRIYYKYAWRIDPNTSDSKYIFWYDKIHGVKGWKWEYPVHETLTCENPELYSGTFYMDSDKVYLKHHPDTTKSRSNYLPLLELRASENPDDLYGQYYLAREFGFHNDNKNAVLWDLKLYLRIITDKNSPCVKELLTDMWMFPCILTHLADSLHRCGANADAEYYYQKAIKECPSYRMAYINYAQMLAYSNRSKDCFNIIDQMRESSTEIDDWRCPKWAWKSWKVNQILADAYCWEGQYETAKHLLDSALSDMDDYDRIDANEQGFFNDYNFVLNKLGEK